MAGTNTLEGVRSKQSHAILSLPESPEYPIYWVVYNSDMVNGVKKLIVELRGQAYLDQHVHVISGEDRPVVNRGRLYFDPTFYDLWGNGNG